MVINKLFRILFIISISLLTGGCLDKYDAPISENKIGYLVIDGFINTTSKTATVKLSRAISLSASEAFPTVGNATVIVEGEDGSTTTLIERPKGIYELTSSVFANPTRFRLKTILNDGMQYESDFIQPLVTPPIDSITWKPNQNGITVYVNTHNDIDQTKFYKWNFTETWSYSAQYFSYFNLQNGEAFIRKPEEYIYDCYSKEKSSAIIIGSTVRLSKNAVRNLPLTAINKESRKLFQRYSILVEQRSLDADAYNYWNNLQKSSENLGGLFDPLPSQVTGNIRNTGDDKDPVFGYFSAGTVEQQRLFISFSELPSYLRSIKYNLCEVVKVPLKDLGNLASQNVLLEAYGQPVIEGYTATTYECADCRTYGGTTTKPDFWP